MTLEPFGVYAVLHILFRFAAALVGIFVGPKKKRSNSFKPSENSLLCPSEREMVGIGKTDS